MTHEERFLFDLQGFLVVKGVLGDGGFACVPGSHRSNFLDLLPPTWATTNAMRPTC